MDFGSDEPDESDLDDEEDDDDDKDDEVFDKSVTMMIRRRMMRLMTAKVDT